MSTDPSPTEKPERSPSSDEFHRALGEHLARIERDGTRALDEFQQKHPQHAARLGKQIDWLMQHLGKRGDGVPKQIGPFRVLQKLGSGGMGEVFLCEQTEPFQRVVAVKVIRADRASEGRVSRFLSEIQALASLNHDGIAKVFEAGLDHGSPFFAMEYVPGVPISDYCTAERLDLAARLHLFVRICRAVEHAHRNGILHRDLKPSNILVYGPATEPVVKIIDFGLAKAIAPEADVGKRTMTGQMLGTPDYMSPEQVDDGPGHGVDTRADVYALGVVLYELLTGVLPLSLWQMGRDDVRAMLQAIRERKPSSPSKRVEESSVEGSAPPSIGDVTSPRRLRRMLQGDLDAIVMQALHKDAEARYGSAADLAEDVLRHLRHEPVRARDATRSYVLYKFVRRHRAAVAFATTVLVLSFAGLVTINVLARQSIRNLERSELFGIAHYLEWLEAQDAEPEAARPENLPALQARLAEFERVFAERTRLQQFLDRNPDELADATGWANGVEPTTAVRSVVANTLRRMDALERPHAELPQLRARIQWAKDVERQTVELHAGAWRRVRAEVKADRRFGGLDLAPQPGLIPLRRHPTTELQEFALQLPGGQMPQLGERGYTIGPDTCPVFVLLPGASFHSGSQNQHPDQPRYDPLGFDGEAPLQTIELPPLFVSEFELTNGQWGLIAPIDPEKTRSRDSAAVAEFDRRQLLHALYAWGMRPPTGIEWEYCARAGSEGPSWCGTTESSVEGHANVHDAALRTGRGEGRLAPWNDGFPAVAPVGSFGHNEFLMYDVLGNVAEIAVRELDEHQSPVLELRGGSWHQGLEAARSTWNVKWHGQPVPSLGCRPVIDVVQ